MIRLTLLIITTTRIRIHDFFNLHTFMFVHQITSEKGVKKSKINYYYRGEKQKNSLTSYNLLNKDPMPILFSRVTVSVNNFGHFGSTSLRGLSLQEGLSDIILKDV